MSPAHGAAALPLAGVSVLVTGATGAVGRRLVTALLAEAARVSVLTRNPDKARALWPVDAVRVRPGDVTVPASLGPALAGVEVVFHLASHQPPVGAKDLYGQPAHWAVSAEGTRHLLTAAAATGVSRLIYLSSVMAVGAGPVGARAALDETVPCAPETRYGQAKLAAERAVLAFGTARPQRVHTCVLRVPMVYGLPGAGNIERLVAAVRRRRFPPWPRQYNRRSAVHVDDVVAALRLAGTHPQAAGRLYFVTDGDAHSTRWLFETACQALGRDVPRWTVPLWTLRAGARLGDAVERLSNRAAPLNTVSLRKLTGDAWFSNARIAAELGFVPRHHLRDEIERLAQSLRAQPRA
ncbi:NAD(P)-dependent oxidoreductase [uncultured Thiohalocapsa sp.]|uniref:NAD-dependent epimerase/dehydratase family protein n=1 Tax=uncultured Thiohalocapsa sp. TaxID=768990 RepID=UPI0025E2E484|nr:NAD-dependent epimerase/dehydratase family protein [uncultured Thiohalocapsa sp.]